jgi:general secretion pathway protein E
MRGIMVQKLIRKLCVHCLGQGCDECKGIGYRGRTLLTELAVFTKPSDLSDVLEGKGNYYTFTDDYLQKLQSGVTDARELERSTGKRYCYETAKLVSTVD